MIYITAKNTFKNEDVNKVIELFSEMVKKTREENGCVRYELFQDTKNRGILTLLEEWSDMISFEKHLKTEHYLKIIPEIGKLSIKEKDVNIYEKNSIILVVIKNMLTIKR